MELKLKKATVSNCSYYKLNSRKLAIQLLKIMSNQVLSNASRLSALVTARLDHFSQKIEEKLVSQQHIQWSVRSSNRAGSEILN